MRGAQHQSDEMKSKSTGRRKPDGVQAHRTGVLLVPTKQHMKGSAVCEGAKSCMSLFPSPCSRQAEKQPKQLRGSQKNEGANEFSRIS